MNIGDVIGWKFNHQPGMRCKQIDGVLTIIEFPGGIPSQADQDLWTQEYSNWVASGGLKDIDAIKLDDPKKAFAAVLEILWDNSAELRAAFPTKAALKQAVVAAYRAKL